MEQTNQYIKQFPELMKGKKILYVHGFGSSGQSGTVTRIREVLPNAAVIAPDLPIEPEEAMTLLREVCEQESPDLIIGTSMGGMYAEMLRGYDRIVVNPALEMGETMKAHGMIGAQHFSNPRQDGIQDFIVTKTLAKAYKEMTDHCFEGLDDEDKQHVWGLFGDADTTVDTYDLFHTHYPTAIRFHGEHRMNDKSFMQSVVPVIRWIDDQQERRERPIIYIGIETMKEWNQKPASSVQKAVRQLIEQYQVYFVAEDEATSKEWLTEYIGVPAWRHTIITWRRDLLYGDYLISSKKEGETMATYLEYGSDTFKTWEDIITYFSHLGGQ